MNNKKLITKRGIVTDDQIKKYQKIHDNLLDYLITYDGKNLIDYGSKIPFVLDKIKFKLLSLRFTGWIKNRQAIKTLKTLRRFFKQNRKEIKNTLAIIEANDQPIYDELQKSLQLETSNDRITLIYNDKIYEIWKLDHFDKRLEECVGFLGFLDKKAAVNWFKDMIQKRSGTAYLKQYLDADQHFFENNLRPI